MRWLTVIGSLALAGGCRPETTRPNFGPVTGATEAEIKLTVPRATRELADALIRDSIPIIKIETRDGFLESPWFEVNSGLPTSRRPLGPEVVRVRAWVDPSRPGHSYLTVETLFRPLADPSLPERELDREVPPNHPIGLKVRNVLKRLVQRYGEPVPGDTVRQ